MDPNSPFDDGGVDPMLYLKAAKRKAHLDSAAQAGTFPTSQPPSSRFTPKADDNTDSIIDILSRFLRPGSQTAPAAPKFNRKGVEDDTEMK